MAEVILERRHYFEEVDGTLAIHWKNYDGTGADLVTTNDLSHYVTAGYTIRGQSCCTDANGATVTIWTLTI